MLWACPSPVQKKISEREKISLEEIDRIIGLYQESIKINKKFADPHLMITHPLIYKTKILIEGNHYKNNELAKNIRKIFQSVEEHLNKAKILNPDFARIVKEEFERFNDYKNHVQLYYRSKGIKF